MREEKIPQGYKNTEVGVIPEDWLVEPLENFTSFISYGFTNPMPTTSSGPYMITAKDIDNGQIQYKGARTTDTLAFNKLLTPKSKPKKGDLLLTKDGTLGRLALVDDKLICINQSVAILRPNSKIVANFFKLLLESPLYQERMFDDAGGSTIKHIYITIVNKMPLGLPANHEEQNAIATALSDVDALICELEKIISKKQAIKTATMQQLLTGKTRLPQFSLREDGTKKGYKQSELGEIPEDWDVKPLSELVEICSGESPSKFQFLSEGIPYFKVEQLNNDLVYADETPYYIETSRVISAGSIIFPKRGASILSNKIRVLKRDSFMDTNLMTLSCSPELDEIYLLSQLTYHGLDSIADTTSIPQINNKHINPYLVPFTGKQEQLAIATILSVMHEEINVLEKRLNKTRQIKQGMMQELLTGKTRLVQPEA